MHLLIQCLLRRCDEYIEPDRTYDCYNCKKYEEGALFSHVVASLLSLGWPIILSIEGEGGDASVPSPPNTTPAPTRSGTGCCWEGGDASVPTPPGTAPAPTRLGMGRFFLCGHQHIMPPRSITIPPSQTRGTSGLTKMRMVAS